MHQQRLAPRALFVSILIALAASSLPAQLVSAQSTGPAENAPQNASAVTPRSHAPIMIKDWPPSGIFGIETVNYTSSASALANSGAAWIRRNALQWKDVEASPGQRNWDPALDADLQNAIKNGQKVVLIVHGTPAWARTLPTSNCSPIQPSQLPAFANFLRDAVNRYSQAPYNVKYWEIWNEPDAPAGAGLNQPYGCWGIAGDPYYGGRQYADMLKAVAPAMRGANAEIKIVLGGLLLGCKPSTCANKESQYLEGVIVNGGAPHFDIVSFHAYDFYDVGANVVGRYTGPNEWGTTSSADGPVLIAKTRFLRNELSRLGVNGKQLMNTEVGLLCFGCSFAPPNYVTSKAYYVPQAYAAAMVEGLLANVWYSYEGWFQSDLSGPAYTAFKVAANKLSRLTYAGAVTSADVGNGNVRGYRFQRGGKDTWVIWSPTGAPQTVTLGRVPTAITDALGATLPPAQSFVVDAKPLYVEFP